MSAARPERASYPVVLRYGSWPTAVGASGRPSCRTAAALRRRLSRSMRCRIRSSCRTGSWSTAVGCRARAGVVSGGPAVRVLADRRRRERAAVVPHGCRPP
ncbi:hypothetical protein, partial [Streptomyces sp. NPDC001381]|uniref:hypothetical protein n=1 Tax=Streptomyces sp. NPDC001381 TaxID=3364567 RepID=UPI00369B92BC